MSIKRVVVVGVTVVLTSKGLLQGRIEIDRVVFRRSLNVSYFS